MSEDLSVWVHTPNPVDILLMDHVKAWLSGQMPNLGPVWLDYSMDRGCVRIRVNGPTELHDYHAIVRLSQTLRLQFSVTVTTEHICEGRNIFQLELTDEQRVLECLSLQKHPVTAAQLGSATGTVARVNELLRKLVKRGAAKVERVHGSTVKYFTATPSGIAEARGEQPASELPKSTPVKVLEYLGQAPQAVTVKQIASQLDLAKGTVSGAIKVLQREGYAAEAGYRAGDKWPAMYYRITPAGHRALDTEAFGRMAS
jgi:DNA-binding PadR family transcriptional regulator